MQTSGGKEVMKRSINPCDKIPRKNFVKIIDGMFDAEGLKSIRSFLTTCPIPQVN